MRERGISNLTFLTNPHQSLSIRSKAPRKRDLERFGGEMSDFEATYSDFPAS